MAGVVLVLVVAALAPYRSLAPRAFVAAGRGPVDDERTISVAHVAVAAATVYCDGKEVPAGPGFQYVRLDCRIAAPVNSVQFDDFQLVRDRAAKVGDETNLGDNGDRHYFYWAFLDPAGRPVTQLSGPAGPFTARLAFKVPADSRRGYLFYWGLYWGPFGVSTGVPSTFEAPRTPAPAELDRRRRPYRFIPGPSTIRGV
jgi:hypothetical protein